MTSSVDMGGKVDSLLFSGGFLFVGVQNIVGVDHSTGEPKPVIEGVIRIWNMATGQNHNLSGHKVRGRSSHVDNHQHVKCGT